MTVPTMMNGATCAAIVRVAAGERADRPEAELVERGDVDEQDRRGDRAEERGDRGAGQGELHRRRALAAERAEPVDDDRGERGAGEGEPHVAEQAGDAEAVDADDDEQRGAGVDAEDARVGERVAGDALHHRAGQAERDADEQAEHRCAGTRRVADDQVVVEAAGRSGRARRRRCRAGSAWRRRRRCARRRARAAPGTRGRPRRARRDLPAGLGWQPLRQLLRTSRRARRSGSSRVDSRQPLRHSPTCLLSGGEGGCRAARSSPGCPRPTSGIVARRRHPGREGICVGMGGDERAAGLDRRLGNDQRHPST